MATYRFGVYTSTPITLADASNFIWGFDFPLPLSSDLDHAPNLYGIKLRDAESGFVEIHVLNGDEYFKTFLRQAVTPISLQSASDFLWAISEVRRDGAELPDVFAIKVKNTDSGAVELYDLDARANFHRSFQINLPFKLDGAADATWTVGNFGGFNALYSIYSRNTESGFVEVIVLDGRTNFQSIALAAITPIPTDDAANFLWGAWKGELHAIKVRNTQSLNVELYILDSESKFQVVSGHIDMFVSLDTAENIAWDPKGADFDYNCRVKFRNTETGFVEVMVGPIETSALLSKYFGLRFG